MAAVIVVEGHIRYEMIIDAFLNFLSLMTRPALFATPTNCWLSPN